MELADTRPIGADSAVRSSLRLIGLAVCLALMSARTALAQDVTSPLFTRVGFAPGYVMPTNPLLSSDDLADKRVRWTPSLTVEIGRQTDGSQDWHHLYGLPSYGFGVSIASVGNRVDFSKPVDAYTFFSWPFARLSDRAQVTTDFGMGLSWNWKEFDSGTNSYNTVLGSDMNVRIDWGFYLRYMVTPQASLYAGVDYTHRSNGGMRQPDEGINVIGPSVALRYNLAPARRALPAREPPPFRPAWEVIIGGAGGLKNVIEQRKPLIRSDYGAFDVTAGLQRHFYRFGKVATGADFIYDGGTGAKADIVEGAIVQRRAEAVDRLMVGVYGGYEHIIGRFSALLHVGYNVADRFDDPSSPRLYQRYGWRYQVSDRFWGLFAIRATEFNKADFIEFGAGYRIRRR